MVSQSAKQGQTLNANQQAPIVLRIADLSTMTVQSQVSEADVSQLRVGMDVYFTTLGSQAKRWYGKLRQINPDARDRQQRRALQRAVRRRRTRDGALMTQMTAQVFFVTAAGQGRGAGAGRARCVGAAGASAARAADGAASEGRRAAPASAEKDAARRPAAHAARRNGAHAAATSDRAGRAQATARSKSARCGSA